MINDLSYPIGKYVPQPFSEELLKEWMNDIRYLPNHLENALLNLDEAQIDTPYRPDGWTVKQLVNHVADSHMNAFIRFKLGLTEDKPVIKPYLQDAWVQLADTNHTAVNLSVTLLHALHARWTTLLQYIAPDEWNRVVVHPEYQKEMSLWYLLGLYAWHGKHHTAHITALRERMNW
jgi:hypothetical protein